MSPAETGLLVTLVMIGLVASYLDVVRRVLPNWLSAVTFLTGIAASFALGGFEAAGSALLHAAIALAAGMGLFAAKAIGGGDAKFYAALAAWFGLDHALFLFVSVALAGLVLIPVWLVARQVKKPAGPLSERDDAFSKLPYGLAISLGACISFAMLANAA
ncbi:prepilin peptidase [Alteraurantiacibacter aestuarii]|uniref:Peptidase A24 n=1 Tax=Alteraurantiacibacter aestuarii TaxID=650004 RepID=A0A844ZKE7_9SPHN|nr:prepilin peptidase [Alteraurantiacibacter aestuarii]MXO87616.1 peptidase A24 [Alteraurantiacibacter aestuarii]